MPATAYLSNEQTNKGLIPQKRLTELTALVDPDFVQPSRTPALYVEQNQLCNTQYKECKYDMTLRGCCEILVICTVKFKRIPPAEGVEESFEYFVNRNTTKNLFG